MFKWQAPEAKKKAQGKPAEAPAAAAVAAQGVTMDAVICRIRTLVDGGVRIDVDLPEMEPAMFALLYALRNKSVAINISDKK